VCGPPALFFRKGGTGQRQIYCKVRGQTGVKGHFEAKEGKLSFWLAGGQRSYNSAVWGTIVYEGAWKKAGLGDS